MPVLSTKTLTPESRAYLDCLIPLVEFSNKEWEPKVIEESLTLQFRTLLSEQGFLPEVVSEIVTKQKDSSVYLILDELEKLATLGYTGQEVLSLFNAKLSNSNLAYDSIQLSSLSFAKSKLEANQLIALSSLNCSDGTRLLRNFEAACWMLSEGGTAELVRGLMQLKNVENSEIFKSDTGIRIFVSAGGTIEIAESLLKLRDHEGQYICQTGRAVALFFSAAASNPDLFELAAARDSQHRSYFSYTEDICSFSEAGGTLDVLNQFDQIKDKDGKRFYNGFEIALLTESEIKPDRARYYAEHGLDGASAAMIEKFDGVGEEFLNDGRPKCLLLLATYDPKSFSGRVFSDGTLSYYLNFRDIYDLKIRAVYSVQHLADLISDNSDAILLQIAGHGCQTSIRLAHDLSHYGHTKDPSERSLEISDSRVIEALRKLPETATIFLDSCSTAAGGVQANNLANHLGTKIGARKLIAAKADIFPNLMQVNSVFPLELSLYDDRLVDQTLVWSNGTCQEWSDNKMNDPYNRFPQDVITNLGHLLIKDEDISEQLSNLQREILISTRPLFDADDILKAGVKFSKIAGYTVLEASKPFIDYDMTPATYIFGKYLHEPWCPSYSKLLGKAAQLTTNTYNFLLEHGYEVVDSPKDGDVAVYLGITPHHRRELSAQHFGIVENAQIRSKLWIGPVCRHPIEAVPKLCGEVVVFFRKTPLDP